MNYHSEFNPTDTEYLFQQIEELKSYLSESALFLLEEEDCDDGIRVVLKAKDGDFLFMVDSTAPSLMLATKAAKETMIDLIVGKKTKTKCQSKTVYLYN